MKITQEQVYKPIMIVLETEDEARAMWACLNWSGQSIDSAFKEKYIAGSQEAIRQAADIMWHDFNKCYRPERAPK